MKKLLYLFLLLPVFLFAQPRYGVEGIPMCWKIGSIDSNITRYVIISSTGSPVQTIAWENAAGQVINVSGGYLRYGYCDCAGSSGGGNGIYGGSGTLPNALVQVQNTQGIKFVEPGTQNGILIANKANGAAGIALDPAYTDSIRQGLVWKQGADSAAIGIDKDGRLQLLSNNWVAIGNDQAKIIIRKDDAVVLIKTGNNVYGLADGVPLSGKNNVMLWPNGSASGRFANLDSLVDGRAKRDTFITVPPNTNYFQNNIDNPARFYNNIYLSCKGRTDTSVVVFLANPVFEEQKGVVYHIKNDSGLVAAFVINYEHLSNLKRFYLLKRGQTAQVRLLPDAANGGQYGWAVDVVWDSIPAPAALSGTPRTVPFFNNAGKLVYNTFFRIDTTTSSGAQAKYRLLINNPNGTAGEGDSYSVLSVRAGDGPGTEAIFNIGDQAATMATTGYNSVFQLYRARGTFESKANLQNGDNIGNFSWRGQANGGSRALGSIALTYTGDGNSYRSQMFGQTSTAAGQNQSGWKLDDQSRFWLGAGADDYHFPLSAPTSDAGMYSLVHWNGVGVGGTTPVWKKYHEGQLGPAVLPAGGVVTVNYGFTFPVPYYNVQITVLDLNGVGTNLTYQLIAQTTTSFSVKFFVANTGVAATGGNYLIYYKLSEL